MNKPTAITIRTSTEIKAALEAEARRQGRSVSNLVRLIVSNGLKKGGSK